uniref:ATP synthase complex subunit 8 n=2 Tax=unclassified Desmopachria TaxID=2640228 RepID=A0A873QJ98_9DYTI|nr:ATP synthase F0 subunit 8 [Desmopachria sp. ITV9392]QPA36187.1 ATP synthase F0 subunit 8 [Desmopachria sp. RRMO-2020]QPA36200.1 ATP synthase F0 subunit 8 [Desmopachria sp. RRMO-2020]QPA36213.1 ATP synthase F0 subunit 8 [Desmopachria sp. RRMO-2020]QPA36226.1 ATP synthase F0 subunit 8 [Desmopachria sp. RRMO-2020]
MPQMMPMNWTILYLFFLILFFLINFINYYSFLIYKNSNLLNKINLKSLNWKW